MKRLLLLLPLACLAQDVVPVVCPDCNREALEPPWICPKCGKQLEPPAVAPDPEPDPEPSGGRAPSGPSDAAAAIRENARFAAARAAADPADALAAVRNALALSALAPDALSAADRKALVERETALLARLAAEIAPCPHCHGTGRVDAPRLPKPAARGKNFKSIESVAVKDINAQPTQPCPLCGGSGKVRRATDRKRLAGLVGEGVRDFGRAARAAGLVESGGAWLPAGLAATLSEADRAALHLVETVSRTCPACAGTGTQPCRPCGGVGRVLCGNRDFHSPPKPAGEGADRKAIESTLLAPTATAPCPVCGGTWDAPRAVGCHDCGGRGVSACPSCSGTGSR